MPIIGYRYQRACFPDAGRTQPFGSGATWRDEPVARNDALMMYPPFLTARPG